MKKTQNNILLRIVQTWNINPLPEYRGFRCANCQRYMHKAWHYWLTEGGFLSPVHFCNKCQRVLQVNKLSTSKPVIYPEKKRFGKYPKIVKKEFKNLYSKWNLRKKPQYHIFTCDKCAENHVKMYHIWEYENNIFIELHYCKRCFRPYEAH